MKMVLRNACLYSLMVATIGGVHAANAQGRGSAPNAETPPPSEQADGRVSGQGSAGGMQPATPGGNTGNTAGSARPAAQESRGGRQPVTPASGTDH